MMGDLLQEAVRAAIWTTVGLFPVMFGVGIHMWSDIRSLKKSLNAAFEKIRALEGHEGDGCKSRR